MRLTEIAKTGLSKSQLSRFEYGETDLAITGFMVTLDEINIPIEEFMCAAHDFQQNEFNTLLERIFRYRKSRDSYQWYNS